MANANILTDFLLTRPTLWKFSSLYFNGLIFSFFLFTSHFKLLGVEPPPFRSEEWQKSFKNSQKSADGLAFLHHFESPPNLEVIWLIAAYLALSSSSGFHYQDWWPSAVSPTVQRLRDLPPSSHDLQQKPIICSLVIHYKCWVEIKARFPTICMNGFVFRWYNGSYFNRSASDDPKQPLKPNKVAFL